MLDLSNDSGGVTSVGEGTGKRQAEKNEAKEVEKLEAELKREQLEKREAETAEVVKQETLDVQAPDVPSTRFPTGCIELVEEEGDLEPNALDKLNELLGF